jgi:hypothetical protein
MNAHRTALRVPENHVLQIVVPEFEAGTDVEVIVLPQQTTTTQFFDEASTENADLHGSVLRYDAPFESVAANDWEVAP